MGPTRMIDVRSYTHHAHLITLYEWKGVVCDTLHTLRICSLLPCLRWVSDLNIVTIIKSFAAGLKDPFNVTVHVFFSHGDLILAYTLTRFESEAEEIY